MLRAGPQESALSPQSSQDFTEKLENCYSEHEPPTSPMIFDIQVQPATELCRVQGLLLGAGRHGRALIRRSQSGQGDTHAGTSVPSGLAGRAL